ncbi:DnaJ subfamily C member 8 [Umbelopsis sp. WA50703]
MATSTPPKDDIDIDRYLTQSEKHMEIDRILSSFKLDPFSILELPYKDVDPKALKLAYRKRSLMVHPDKVDHPKAQDAFDTLKKAESELSDESRVRFILGIVEEAKVEVLRKQGIKVKMIPSKVEVNEDDKSDAPPTVTMIPARIDEAEYPYISTPEGLQAVKEQLKAILIEMELRKRRLRKKEMEAEGEIARKTEEAMAERKRKAEEAKQWEATRETRVNSWRDFQKKGGAKKIKKKKTS